MSGIIFENRGQTTFSQEEREKNVVCPLFPNRISGKLYDHALIAQMDRASAS